MQRLIQFLIMAFALATVSACSTQTVKTTELTPAITGGANIPEEQLLDVGVAIFDPGLDMIDDDQQELTFGDVRRAETYYTSHLLAETLQRTGLWGVVRVIPGDDLSTSDLAVRGTILQSDGEAMRVHIVATDSSGRVWMDKEYEEIVSRYSYDPRMRRDADPFQGLYNRIANDLVQFRRENLTGQDLLALRAISEIQFARDFAPEVYDDYLTRTRDERLAVARLPAENDPIMSRIRTIRERDYLYVDTMQEYYGNYARQMEGPYTEFRRLSYDEVVKLDRLQADARRNMILGIASIIGGLASTQADGSLANVGVIGGISVGGWLIKDAFRSNDEAQMHVEALAELGQSLETDVAPRTIELEERSITLSGSVESQYAQWREILADMYANETGETLSSNP